MKELRTLVIDEERHPNENDIWEALEFANKKHCIVKLVWFIPHYGWKRWFIKPDSDIQKLLTDLHILHNE